MMRAGRMLSGMAGPRQRVMGRRLRQAAPMVPQPVGDGPSAAPAYKKGGAVDGVAVKGRTKGKLV